MLAAETEHLEVITLMEAVCAFRDHVHEEAAIISCLWRENIRVTRTRQAKELR